ncbi:hypothetical protein Tco_0808274, partial [Tanacetum coccineum]
VGKELIPSASANWRCLLTDPSLIVLTLPSIIVVNSISPLSSVLAVAGRKIVEIDQDPDISLVQHDVEIQGRYGHDMEFDFDAAKEVSTAGTTITTASVAMSTANLTRNIRVSTADDITMAKTLVYIRKSSIKDKGKGKMDESKKVKTKTKLQQEQERHDFEAAVRLQVELEEDERQRIARLQADEREKYTEAEQARMLADLINQRKRYFVAQRAKERRNKPPTQAQQRTYISNYIKNMGGYTLQHLRGYSFDEIKTLFETTMRKVNTFILIESEVDRAVPELAARSSKRPQKKNLIKKVLRGKGLKGMNVEALQTKYTIIDWEIYIEGTRKYWKIIIVGNHTKVELKRLFEPDTDEELWKLKKHIHDLTWKLYDSCGVHYVSTEKGIDIYMLVEKEYPLSRGTLTLMLVVKIMVDQDNEMSRELLRKIFMQASEDISDAPMVEKLVSVDKLEKKTVFPTVAKIEFVRAKQQEKPVRKPVKYAEMYRVIHKKKIKAMLTVDAQGI